MDEEMSDQSIDEELVITNSTREINVIISSHQNTVSIHTDSWKYFICSNNDASSSDSSSQSDSFWEYIIDINKLTRNLNPDQIKELWIRELVPQFEGDQDDFKLDSSEIDVESVKEDDQMEIEENTYGLDQRIRNQKLTTDQIHLLKSILDKNLFTTKEISVKYNVSCSVLKINQ